MLYRNKKRVRKKLSHVGREEEEEEERVIIRKGII